MITTQEKQIIIAEARVIAAAHVLDGWYRHVLKEGCFTLDDMSESELDFMEAVKALRKAKRKPNEKSKDRPQD